MVNDSRATVLDAIGSTPLIEVDGLWLKLESSILRSIKARMAVTSLNRAEREDCYTPATRSSKRRVATRATP